MPAPGLPIPLEQYFADHDPLSRALFDAVRAMVESLGDAEMRVTKSEVAFARRTTFALTWMPEQYLRRPAAPLVLTLSLLRRDPSPRFKQIVEPRPGRFTHHLELYSTKDLDDEVLRWLREAWEQAG